MDRRARSIVIAATGVAVLLIGTFIAWLVSQNRPEGEADSDESVAAAVSQPIDAVADAQSTGAGAARARWRDGVADEILDVSGKIDQLERQSQQLWSDPETH